MTARRPRAAGAALHGLAVGHPVATVVGAALALRLLVVLGSALWGPAYLAPDERSYVELATVVARGDDPATWADGYGASLYRSTLVFTAPLALAFQVLEPARAVGQVLAAVFGAVTAGLTAQVALSGGAARRHALAGGLLVAALPSQVFWSSLALRESMVWAALAAIALAVTWASKRPAAALCLAAGSLLALGFLRTQTMLAAAVALVVAALVVPRQRWSRAAAALALALVVPALAGTGVGGVDLVRSAAPSLATTRDALSAGAASALTESVEPGRSPSEFEGAADGSSGALEIARRGARERESGASTREEGLAANLRALPHGVAGFLVRPVPGERVRNSGVLLAELDNILWYGLYVASVAALLVLRRQVVLLAFPSALLVVMTGLNAVTQGNVGTAFRHRGQVGWAVALLAVAGAAELARRRRTGDEGAVPREQRDSGASG